MSDSFIQKTGIPQVQSQFVLVRRLLVGGLVLLLCVPVCFLVDLQVATSVNHQMLPGDLRTILSCAEAFSHFYGVSLILLAIWLSAPHLRQKLKATVLLLIVTSCVISLAKNCVLRMRPRQNAADNLDSVWDSFVGINPAITSFDFSNFGDSGFQSYPSGHTAMAFCLAIGLTLAIPKSRGIFFLFAFLAAGQRIGFAAHYLSDVFAGAAFAMICSATFLATSYARRTFFSEPAKFPVVESVTKSNRQGDSRAQEPNSRQNEDVAHESQSHAA